MVPQDVITRLERLRTREHECLVQIVEGLVECLRSRMYLDLGYESLWKLLVERLGYSEGAAALSFSLDPDAFADFERAKELLSSKLPAGVTPERAFNELVRFHLLKKDPKQRSARRTRRTSTVEATVPTSTVEVRSRHLPAAQIDHVHPHALGGPARADNLRVLCGAHNRHRARRTFPCRP